MQKELHLRKAQAFYDRMKQYSELAKNDDTIEVLSFDFQQNLPLPHISVGDIFYARQLWVYNFCVHVASSNDAYMFVWPEGDAKRGCNEVLSCLNSYFETFLRPTVKQLFLFSDACAGQNRNKTVMNYMYALIKLGLTKIQVIEHSFPTRGHSFLPCDRDFGLIEKVKRQRETVFTVDEWIDVIVSARPSHPFTVIKLDPGNILDYQSHFVKYFKQSVTNKEKERLMLSKVKCLKYSTSDPLQVQVFENSQMNGEMRFVIEKSNMSVRMPLVPAYNKPVPIKPAKLKDLKTIVEKFVPVQFRAFYEQRYNNNEPLLEDSDSADSEADSLSSDDE